MRTDTVVLSESLVDDDLRLPCYAEPLGIEHLAAKRSVKAFIVSVL